jgi:hypothetical protein
MAMALARFADDVDPGESLAPKPSSGNGTTAARMAAALAKTEAAIPPPSSRAAGGGVAVLPPAPRVAAALPAVPDEPPRRVRWPARSDDDFRPPRDRSGALLVVGLAAIAGVVATTLYVSSRRDEHASSRAPAPAERGATVSATEPPVATPPSAALTAPPADQPAAAGPVTAHELDRSSSSAAQPRSEVVSMPPRPASGPVAARVPATPPDSPGTSTSGTSVPAPGPESPLPTTDTAVAPDEEVSIRLRITPRSATVTIGEKPVSGRRVALQRSTQAVPVRVQAPGYVPRTVQLIPDQDQDLAVELVKAAPSQPPPEKPPSSDTEAPADHDSPAEEPTPKQPEPDHAPEDGDDG